MRIHLHTCKLFELQVSEGLCFSVAGIMAEWAQQRKDAKSQVVALDVKALMAEAMKDGFDSYMTAVVVPCLILGVD